MGRQAPIQTNFTAGEISPRLIGRTDIERYKNGCKTLKNFKVLPHGGATKRAGTRFIAEVKDSTKLSRLIPFVFSSSQAYQLVFGEKSIRAVTAHAVLAGGEYLPDYSFANGINLWTVSTNGAGSATWNIGGYVLMDSGTAVSHRGQLDYVVSLPMVPVTVAAVISSFSNSNSTMNLDIIDDKTNVLITSGIRSTDGTISLSFTPTSERTKIRVYILFGTANTTCRLDSVSAKNTTQTEWEMACPYDDADLGKIKHAQSADTLYLVHPSYPPQKLVRYGATEWNCIPITFLNGPYRDANNDTASTITPSATTGSVTLTASKPVFRSGHIGAYWRITHGATTGYVKIALYTSALSVTAQVITTLGGTTATNVWAEGAWSTYRGFPAAVGFYEQRLWFGRNASQPAHLWGSASGDFENMTEGATDNDAVIYELTESQVNEINWLSPSRFLLAGTSDVEHRIGQEDLPITPTNIIARPQTAHGSADYQPVQIGEVTLFSQSSRRKIRELSYSFENASYVAPDLTIFSEHITRPGITYMAYQQEPDSVVWSIRDDGILLGLTYERVQEVIGWHWHQTDGNFESICSTPVSDGDELTCIVKRNVGGVDKRYIEYFAREFEDGDQVENAFYVDSGIEYIGAATTTITGLGHLEGKTVAVLADGAVHPSKVVSGGQITLDFSATPAIVGLPYTATLETLPPPTNIAIGSGQSRPKRWAEIWTRLYNTVGLKVNGKELPFRSTENLMDQPLPLYSGWVNVPNLGHDRDAIITYTHDYPTPCTILVQTGTLDVADE